MHRVLLGFAALTLVGAFSASAPAQGRGGALVATPTTPVDRFGPTPIVDDRFCRNRRDDNGDRPRARCRSEVVMDWYGGEWALYNNRSFAPDSYNDWWHDRPDRAYPAWMRNNRNCQRQWFGGDVLRC
jgi:hypothetical protein